MYAFADYYGHLAVMDNPEAKKPNGKSIWLPFANNGRGKFNSLKLVEAAEYFGISFEELGGAHNSMADVRATALVWKCIQDAQMAYQQRGFATDPLSGEEICDVNGSYCWREEDGRPCINVFTGEAMSFDDDTFCYDMYTLEQLGAWRKR